MRHDVLALADLPSDGLTEVSVGDLKILLARDGDRVLATGATCTHKGAPLKNGKRVGNRVICPWHHAIFDLESGDHLEPPGKGCLSRFAASVENGRVMVEVPDGAKPHRPEVEAGKRQGGEARVFAIVGGGAAGLSCAEELVRRGFDGRIVMFVPEREPPYDRTDLSKTYLQGKKTDDALALYPADKLKGLGVELVETAVERIDAGAKRLHLAGGETLEYDECFAAPGSDAVPLKLEGAEAANVVSLRSHEDARKLKDQLAGAKRIVIVGSGFIGMEAAASLVGDERSVTVISRSELPFAKQFGEDVARQLLATHRAKGVDVRAGAELAALDAHDGKVRAVTLKDGATVEADLVIAALGAAPRSGLVSGAERDGKGIKVDATLKAAEGLHAGGDIAAFPLAATGETARIEHWRVAEQHGRHAAGAMLGDASPFDGIPYFWSAQHGRLSYLGHAEDFDEVHIEGSLAENSYTAFYIKGGKVLAALGIGKGDRTPALHALMLSDPAPDRARLEAAGWDPAAVKA